MAMEANFLTVKYLTGLAQNLAVTISTVYIGTARFCPNPVKYFTDKKVGSFLAYKMP